MDNQNKDSQEIDFSQFNKPQETELVQTQKIFKEKTTLGQKLKNHKWAIYITLLVFSFIFLAFTLIQSRQSSNPWPQPTQKPLPVKQR